jgi:CDP-diacylglycerol--glycerol-3-phosphate 3-phosphatidyltransferase
MNKLFTTPNLVSLGRALLGPLVLMLLLADSFYALLLALVIVSIAIASDFFDGHLARRNESADELGRYVDGACDVIFNLGVFLGFLAIGWLPASWFLAIYFTEIIVPYAGAFSKQIGQPFEIRWSTKLKMVIHPAAQFVMLVMALTMTGPTAAGDTMLGIAILGAAVLASVAFLVDHVVLVFLRTTRPV